MAFDFYFAGGQSSETDDLICSLGGNRLLSYLNDKKLIQWWFNAKQKGWTGKLMIDSGAFTAHRKDTELNIDKYCTWINDNESYIDYVIELDHIPGKWGSVKTPEQVKQSPIKSWQNYLYMTSKVNNPYKILPVFHQGEDYKYLTQMVNHKINNVFIPYICVSGNKELTNSQREVFYSRCFEIIQKSDNPNVKVHCLGSATMSNAIKFPFTSMDATSWIMTGATGSILTKFGPVLVSQQGKYDKKHIDNMPIQARDYVEKYCKDHNISLQQCKENYKYRMFINIYYIHEQSLNTSFNNTFKKQERLF